MISSKFRTNQDVDRKLDSCTVQGFPIVSSDSQRALLGYIGRTELRYVLDKAREARQLGPETICEFLRESNADTVEGGRSTRIRRLDSDSSWEATMDTDTPTQQGFAQTEQQREPELLVPVASWGTGLGIEDNDSEIELHLLREDRTGAGENVMRLEPWVNQTPLTVGPQMPLEIVVQLFKRLGPRVILVEKLGSLVGLITVKDVLRFIEREEAEHHTRSRAPGHTGLGAAAVVSLESLLEDARSWLIARMRR